MSFSGIAAEWQVDVATGDDVAAAADSTGATKFKTIHAAVDKAAKDDVVPVRVLIDRNPGFDEPIGLLLGKKNSMFSLDPISIEPHETEKIIYIKLNKELMQKHINKKNYPTWQMSIVGTVKGEVERQGKRSFQNAMYSEMTPFFLIKLKK